MLTESTWKELEGTRRYVSTGKEVSPEGSNLELAYWMLASRINDTFGREPATIGEIYHRITRPLKMTSLETVQLVRDAKKQGYLRIV